MITNIENLKKKDFFKLEKGKKVYQYDGYNRSTKKYSATAFDDSANFRDFKKGTKVKIGFEF